MREIVILCRGSTFWNVYRVMDGLAYRDYAELPFASAHELAIKAMFAPGWDRDFISTNRAIEAIEGRWEEPGRTATVLLPEGGAPHLKDLWMSHCFRTNGVGERFHVSNLRQRVEMRDLIPLSDTALAPELEVRRDWVAFDFSAGVIERQRLEAEASERLESQAAAMAVDKEASVRQWGTSSPYFVELFGTMPVPEWDRLWQRWQSEMTETQRRAEETV